MDNEREAFLEAANSIGARLCRDALWAGERCNWLGDSMEYVGNAWTVVNRSFGPELYSGTGGIALFLSRLFRLTPEKPYRTTAEGAMRQAVSRTAGVSPASRVGFYAGLTGIAYTLLELAETFDNPALGAQALMILEDLARNGAEGQALDVIAGSAGAIPALLDIYHRRRKDFLLDFALREGDRLLSKASRNENGWSWDTLNSPGQPHLTGFSHGTAGIAWALLELFQETGLERFRAAAEEAFRYERHWFNPQYGNWPDLRNLQGSGAGGDSAAVYGVAWCHGAPGIGLSRVRAFEILAAESCRAEAETALQTTAYSMSQPLYGVQANYSLCHGLGGNAELLIYGADVLARPDLIALARQAGSAGIEQYQKPRAPWPCGVPGGGETPNLMLGLAGIGYFYLRLYDSQMFPSILIIRPQNSHR